jgi:dihydrofolate reductase
MSGSTTLVRWLLAKGLLDRLNLMVHPIAVGKGQRLFEDTLTHSLRLLSHEAFTSGVLNSRTLPRTTRSRRSRPRHPGLIHR